MRKAAKRILFILYVPIVTFLFTEAALWLFAPIPLHQPVSQTYKLNLPGVKESVLYTLDERGLRTSPRKSEKRAGSTIRILAMGASTTQSVTQSFEDTWYGILEQQLNKDRSSDQKRVEVAGWGQGGLKVWNGYQFCEDGLADYHPDIVITLWGVNNLAFDGGPEYAYTNRTKRLAEIDRWARLRPLKRLASRYSQVYRRLHRIALNVRMQKGIRSGTAVENWQNKLPQIREKYRKLPYTDQVSRNPDPVVEFRDSLDALLLCLQSNSAEVVVMGQPVLWKPNMTDEENSALWFPINSKIGKVRPSGTWLVNEMHKYNQIQEELAHKYGFPFVDLDASIPKDLRYYFDDFHFTDEGNKTIADTLYPVLLNSVRIKRTR